MKIIVRKNRGNFLPFLCSDRAFTFRKSADRKSRNSSRDWSCGMATNYLFICFVVLSALIVYSWLYKVVHSHDPCDVARSFEPAVSNHRLSIERTALPKVIHQQWRNEQLPPDSKYAKYHSAFKRLFPEPEYKHILWTDEKMRKLIATNYSFFLPTYDEYDFAINRVDAARYFILHAYGGLYADMDYEPLANFWDFLPTDQPGFVESPYAYNEVHQNSLMSSPKHDPFWTEHAFPTLLEVKNRGVFAATGPSFVDTAVSKTTRHVKLPCELFHRIPFSQEYGELSPLLTRLERHTRGRFYPMKYCGDFSRTSGNCQLGRHHNAVSYMSDVPLLRQLFGK